MKRIKCWLTRHHWLLQRKLPVGYDHRYIYEYQCQVCGKMKNQKVINLDEMTTKQEEIDNE